MTDIVYLRDFMCVCSDDERAKSEACIERVSSKLGAEPGTLLTAVVYALEWGLGGEDQRVVANIDGISCDMWCAINGTVLRMGKSKCEEVAHIYIQCDEVEHGVARFYELAAEFAEFASGDE